MKTAQSIALAVAFATALLTAHPLRAQAEGRSFYVDTAGSDSNTGTSPTSPWRTLSKVNATALLPGDTIHLKRGCLWRETLIPSRGGEPGRPVTFTGYGSGAPPIVSGSDLIKGWSPVGRSAYRATISGQPNNVYVDGGPGWGLPRANRKNDLGSGSWFWDAADGSLYLRMPDDSDPSAHAIEAAVRIHGMKVLADSSEKGNIVVDGLAFERTGGYGIFFYSNAEAGVGPTGVLIRNNRVSQTGTGRIDGGQYFNAIHFSEHSELATAPRFINNSISYSGGHGNAINSQNADGAQLIGNRADHFNHHGFDTKGSAGVVIRGNVAHDSPDNNGIYQESCRDGLIEGNFVYNLGGSVPGRGSGIQVDVGSSGARILHNSIFNVLTGIYLTVPATVQYNAVSQAHHAVLEANAGGVFDHNVWGRAPVFFVDGRWYSFGEWVAGRGAQGDIAADPQWTNPADGDFALLPSSPCLAMNAGARESSAQTAVLGGTDRN